ncbi:hypothetical protein F4776DRAFT_616288 [Hypoxylon sp. NC0597]|nr:hypothetical protein F4776DRAFT_616288 [Hypoxylon sp. NC0597]
MASRQKSCVPCANAKRRCEPQTPKCPRCARRGVDCYYKNQPVRTSGGSSEDDLDIVAESGNTAPICNGNASQDAQTRQANGTIGTSLVGGTPLSTSRQIRMPGFHPECPFIVPVAIMNKRSIQGLTRDVMSWPGKFVRKLQAPFIHSSLLDALALPRPLEDAFSACATYACKEETTKDIVMSIIEKKVAQLIAMDLSTISLEEHLAALQAFLILHTIQLWDGDVRQRAQAEMHSYIIESWALQLHRRAMEVSKQQDFPITWEWWITLESARRTAIASIMAQGIYEMNKYGVCSYLTSLTDMSFTTHDGPWNAQNPGDWKERIVHLEATVASYGDYANSWVGSSGNPDSEFGQFLLKPCPGHVESDLIIPN